MASKVYPIRADEADRAKWQAAADADGLSFNAWARNALNSQADLDQALARLPETADVKKTFSDFSFRPDPKKK